MCPKCGPEAVCRAAPPAHRSQRSQNKALREPERRPTQNSLGRAVPHATARVRRLIPAALTERGADLPDPLPQRGRSPVLSGGGGGTAATPRIREPRKIPNRNALRLMPILWGSSCPSTLSVHGKATRETHQKHILLNTLCEYSMTWAAEQPKIIPTCMLMLNVVELCHRPAAPSRYRDCCSKNMCRKTLMRKSRVYNHKNP